MTILTNRCAHCQYLLGLTNTYWLSILNKYEGKETVQILLGNSMQKGTMLFFGSRLQATRKLKGWSQPDLAKKVGTSGAIIGRYERGEMSPSIEMAGKLAEALEVSLDYLWHDTGLPMILQDQKMLARWKDLANLSSEEQERILFVMDSLIRDAKARKTYAA